VAGLRGLRAAVRARAVRKTFGEVERYGYQSDIMPGDWLATNVWLDSTDCTLQRGVWLALCENGRMIPISERALADDPGHALLLEGWSAATGRRATLVDAARLNTLLNGVGLVILAALLFQLRAWLAALALLVLGPHEYLFWMGTSPHWSYNRRGEVWPRACRLPLLAQAEGLLGRRGARGLDRRRAFSSRGRGAGARIRSASWASCSRWRRSAGRRSRRRARLAQVGRRRPWPAVHRRRRTRGLRGTALDGGGARWLLFDMAPAERLQRHGLTHTLYLGLGFVENKFSAIPPTTTITAREVRAPAGPMIAADHRGLLAPSISG
jgi:hypothetical protein